MVSVFSEFPRILKKTYSFPANLDLTLFPTLTLFSMEARVFPNADPLAKRML